MLVIFDKGMKIKITRNKAKDKIAERRYFFLTQSDKLKILEIFFPSLEETGDIRSLIVDGVLPNLDNDIIQLIESTEYLNIPFSNTLKPIFVFKLKEELFGVTNEYLQWQLNDKGNEYVVIGNIEQKGLCPCCRFYSIRIGEDGLFDICSVCFWENGGDTPNYMTLEKAQNNFKTLGAINETSLKFIDPEGKIKYKKGHN